MLLQRNNKFIIINYSNYNILYDRNSSVFFTWSVKKNSSMLRVYDVDIGSR